MRLTRVYVAAELASGSLVELPRETAAHLSKVLRARSGDELILFNGDGREFWGAIETVRGARVTAAVGRGAAVDRESPLAVTLVQCVPRGDRMDFIVQKATELGVARIVPVLSQRSVVRLDGAQSESKAAHWRAVAVSACEQCGRNRLPALDAPLPLLNYLDHLGQPDRLSKLDALGQPDPLGGGAPALRLLLQPDLDAAPAPTNPGAEVAVAIGPEGGFADDELEALRLCGFMGVRLGPRILRTETAALAALTWLQTRYGDLTGV